MYLMFHQNLKTKNVPVNGMFYLQSKHEYLLLWKGDDLVARSNMKDVSALGFKVVLNDTDIAATKEVAQYRDAGEYTCVHQDNTRELRLRTTQVIVYGR